jgi:hypothetical protein
VSRAAGYDLGMMVPRSSGSLAIPAGPHSMTTPAPGFLMTPAPFPAHPGNTPGAGVRMMTPAAGSPLTPMPFASELGTAPTSALDSLPKSARTVSVADIAEKEPLPSKYNKIAAAMILAAVAIGVFLFVRGDKKDSGESPKNIPTLGNPGVDNETRLKAALHDLESGKTCADRKAAIPTLVEIGDERAIPSLKKARYRMRGGLLGVGDSNTNACLKQDAEMAIQAIEGPMRD